MEKMRKMIAMLLVLCTFVSLIGGKTVPAKASNSVRKYVGESYYITYEIVNRWENGGQIQVLIANTGIETIKNWGLQADSNGVITSIWNAAVESNGGNVVKIRNNQYNGEIQPGESVQFGCILNDITREYPEKMILTQQIREVSSDYDVEYSIVNDWGSGFQGNLVITNQKSEPIEGWEFVFNSNSTLNNVWGAEYAVFGNQITLKSFNYANRIEPGQRVIIGFTGVKEEEEAVEFTNYVLTEVITYPKGNSGGEEATTEETTESTQEETESVTEPTTEIDYITDTDNDGLCDYLEKEFGCEVDNPDTDGDGLPDGYEIYTLGTNPTLIDSDGNGITDDLEDFDDDGLSNIEEYTADTDPFLEDSDFDGLLDYEELKIYGTNPNDADTDDDFVTDLDEILIGLDPNNPETFQYPDGQYKFQQRVSGDSWMMAEINAIDDAPYHLSVSMNAAGIAENNFSAQVSGYSQVMKNDAVIGEIAELFYKDGLDCEELTIEFHINENTKLMLSDADMPEELQGIKRINVFRYDEELNMLLPMETFFDENGEVAYVKDARLGSYCLMDMAVWFESLGYNLYGDSAEMVSLYSLYEDDFDDADEWVEELEKEKIFGQICQTPEKKVSADSVIADDECVLEEVYAPMMLAAGGEYLTNPEFYCDKYDMIITIQGIGTEEEAYLLELESYKEMGNRLFQKMPELRIKYIISTTPTRINEFEISDWITNAKTNADWLDSKKSIYSSQEYGIYGDYDGGLSCAFDYAIRAVQCRKDAKRAVFWTWNSECTMNEFFEYYTPELAVGIPNTSIFVMANYMYRDNGKKWGIVCAEAETSDRVTAFSPMDVLDRDARVIGGRLYFWFLDKCKESIEDSISVISATGLRAVPKWYRYISYLDELEFIDTDGDMLTDFEEIDLTHPLVKYNQEEERYIFPTLGEYLKAGGTYTEHALDRYSYADMNYLKENVCVVPLCSDPAMIDSDMDGILDNVYTNPKAADKEIFEWVKNSEEYFNFSDDKPLKAAVVFEWPVNRERGIYIKSSFEEIRDSNYHAAIDLPGYKGDEVLNAYQGIVIYTSKKDNGWCYDCDGPTLPCGCSGGYGNHIVIQSYIEGKYYLVMYAHLSDIYVKQGDFIKQGEMIGAMGSTGFSFGYHLDFNLDVSETMVKVGSDLLSKMRIDPICFDCRLNRIISDNKGKITEYNCEIYMKVPKAVRDDCGERCSKCKEYIEKVKEKYKL